MPTLTIDIEARLAQFQDGLDRVARDAGRTAKSIDRAFSGLKSTLGSLAGLAIGGSIVAQLKIAVQELAALNDGATQAGVSVESLSSLLNTLAPTGVGLQEIVDLAGKLTKAMGQAEVETSKQAAAFKALGVQIKDSFGNLRNADDVLTDVARALSKYSDDANKVAIAQALLEESGARYLPILGDIASRSRAAASVTAEQAKAADDLADRIGDLANAFGVLKQEIVAGVTPALSEFFTRYVALAKLGSGPIDLVEGLFGDSPKEKIAGFERRIAELNRIRTTLAETGDPNFLQRAFNPALRTRNDIDAELIDLAGKLEKARQVQREIDKLFGSPGAAQRPAAPALAGGGRAAGSQLRAVASEFEDFESRVNSSLSRLLQDAPIVKARELEAVIGRLNGLFQQGLDGDVYAGALEAALTGLVQNGAAASDALQILDRAFFELGLSAEAYDKIQKEIFRTTATAGGDGAAGLRDLADRWRDAIDPMREYRRQLDEINRLQGVSGGLDQEEAARAAELVFERIDGHLKESNSQTKLLDDAAKELGMTFSSAFEDAIVEGRGLRDILTGLEQDILRIATRKLVTEPLSNSISSLATQFLPSLLGSGGITPGWVGGGPLPFATGGIMTAAGAVPLRKYSAGGVARSPQAAIFGEGSMPEAYVPLPDGRTIPVTMADGGGVAVSMTVMASDVESFRRSEQQLIGRLASQLERARRTR